MIQFGDKVKDVVSGVEGIVVAIDEWLNGCRRAGVQSKGTKDGEMKNPNWVDMDQLRIVKKNALGLKVRRSAMAAGGPRAIPKRHPDPK